MLVTMIRRCRRTTETKASPPKVGIGRENATDDATKRESLSESYIVTDLRGGEEGHRTL